MSASRFTPLRATAALLERDDMRALGIERTSRIGRARSRREWGRQLAYRQTQFERHLAELARDRRDRGQANGAIELRDGWARDDSRALPHLDALLDEMESVIEERGLQPWEEHGKPFLKDILPPEGWKRYGSILDFACAPEVLEPVARHVGFVPHLSPSLPPGVRLMESSTKYDRQPDGPWRSSQLWHIDYHCSPTIYVIVALRDIGPDDGPLHFLGEATSRRVAESLDYRSRSAPYRVSDEVMNGLIDPSEVERFSAPAGSVMMIDSSRCFHFGSRNPATPRYQLQYAYVSPVRNDFSDVLRPQVDYPVAPSDPLPRRLALDRSLLGA